LLRVALHDGVGLAANGSNSNECVVSSAARELIHGSTKGSDKSISLAANTCRNGSVPATQLHANGSPDALVTKVATFPPALVILSQILTPSLTIWKSWELVPDILDSWAAHLTDRVNNTLQVLSFNEDRRRRGGWRGDGDWFSDCTGQERRGNEDDCSKAS